MNRFKAMETQPLWVLPAALGLMVLLLPYVYNDYALIRQIQLALILSLLVSGLNLSFGYAGELALGQTAMYAAGAYTAGLLSSHGHTDVALQIAAAGVAALVVGIVTGIPGLRLGSWSLAMTSFFLVLLIPDLIAIFSEYTGGRNGLTTMMPPTFMGQALEPGDYYQVVVIVTAAWFVAMRNIAISRHGTALKVLKQSPVLASSMGISVFRMKLLAYALGAIPAGFAGALFANLDLYISPEAFAFSLATAMLAASILGGSASVYGALVGALVLQFGLNQSTSYEKYSLLVTGSFLIVGGVLLTGGLSQLAWTIWSRVTRDGRERVAEAATEVDLPPIDGDRLEIASVSKAFGGNQALDAVDLTAVPGQITALIGPNGSGKTTLLNLICGFYRVDSGSIKIGDRVLHGLPPDSVARAGVGRTFQTPNIPEGISVLEAVMSGRYATQRASVIDAVLRLPRYRRVREGDYVEARRALSLVGLPHLESHVADSLPLGQRRLLEVARCLVSSPGALLLDEAASGLDEREVERLAAVVRRVRDAGGTVVLVEHNFGLVLSLADHIVALAHGQVMARGTPDEIANDPRVLSEYLGVEPSATGGLVLQDIGDMGYGEPDSESTNGTYSGELR